MTIQSLNVATADGAAPAHLALPDHRADGPLSGVILYMDAFGPRRVLDVMAERIAAAGYAVLVPDLFYRFGAYGPFDPKTSFAHEASRNALMGMIGGTSQQMTVSDTAAFLEAMTAAGVNGPIATLGYCMGGGRAMRAACAYPDRIVAAASLHGGGLATDDPQSPHKYLKGAKARFYVGVAGVDQSFPPEQSAALAQALREAEVDHMIENYVGCQHGWSIEGNGPYDAKGAARHWDRIMALFAESL